VNVTRVAEYIRAQASHVQFITISLKDSFYDKSDGLVGVYRNGDLSILGGNQGDAVNIRRFERTRLMALRWPPHLSWIEDAAPWADGPGVATTGEA
jgi:hypothetical protein